MDQLASRIQQTGVRLALSQEVIATAITYYYKFKEFGPFASFKPIEAASACIFLASKVMDEMRKIRDILNCWKLAEGGSYDQELTKNYYSLKERIVECEQVILRTFVFDVEVTHPYVYYLNCCKSLKLSSEVIQCGWSIIVDGYIFHKREIYPSHISLSSDVIQCPLWWELFDVKLSELETCCLDLLSIYEYNICYINNIRNTL